MKKLLITAILACSLVSILPATQAADKPTEETPPKTKAAGRLQLHGTVSAIDKTAKTIALEENGKSRTFQVTSATRIHKDGKPATLDEVAVGESARGTYHEKEGKLELNTLRVGKTGKPEKGPEEKPAK
jgi:hypothetical protein